MGITIESAYQSLVNNDPLAWKIVQASFTADFQSALKHVQAYDKKCKDELYDNLEVNINR